MKAPSELRTCPFCPIGNIRLQKAIGELSDVNVKVIYRSLRLLPGISPRPVSEIIAARYGRKSVDLEAKTIAIGASEELQYNLENAVAGDTMNAHRLVHLARKSNLGQQMIRRLYQAHFTDRMNIFNMDTLVILASEAGLDFKSAREMLQSTTLIEEVERDETRALAFGIRSVPTLLINEEIKISSTQPPNEITSVIRQAVFSNETGR